MNDAALPDFLIIGAMKSGTTSLWADLRANDAFFLPQDKEPNVLVQRTTPEAIRRDYAELFADARPGQIRGEASTWYTKRPMFDGIVERAHVALGPDLRLVMIVRDPVERLISHLKHHLVMGLVRAEDCDRVVLEDPRYTAFSDYGMQLRPWIEAFGRERLLCLGLDAFMADRSGEVRRVAEFLGVERPETVVIDGEIKNEGTQLRSNARSIWRKATRSRLYKRHLRAMIPDRLRDAARDVLLPVRPVPPLRLTPATMAEIEARLAHVEEDVRQLVGLDMRLHRRRPATAEALEAC